MTDGKSYYQFQSKARGIHCLADVEQTALLESRVYDRLLLPHLARRDETRIYEVATGPGVFQAWLRNRGFQRNEGSDISENEVLFAQSVNPRIQGGDSIQDLQERFSDESFDAIIALDFYEHITRENFRRFLAVAERRLKRGGVLIMRGPNADSPLVGTNFYNDVTHVWAYTTQSLRTLLSIAGFSRLSFVDDTKSSLHSGRWWKLPLMIVAQALLTWTFYAASRVKIKYWGASMYVFARK